MVSGYPLKPQMSNELRDHHAQNTLNDFTWKGSAKAKAAEYVVEHAQKAADALYGKCAQAKDEQHIGSLSGQIEDVLKNSPGVLLIRYTIRTPNGAGQTIPHYVGLKVAGDGVDATHAILTYKKKKNDHLNAGSQWPTTCTPDNPSGMAPREHASIRNAPRGFNSGYDAHVARQLLRAMEKNPTNNSTAHIAPVHLQEDFVFLTKSEWEKKKAARVKGWFCFTGDGAGSQAPAAAAPAPSSAPISIAPR